MIGVERLGERKRLSVGMLFSCCVLDGDGIFNKKKNSALACLFFAKTSRSMLLNNTMKVIFYQVLKSF